MYNYPTYNQPFNNYSQYQRQDIIRVNGRPGAEAFQMMPNSSALLLDETAPIVWLAQTDGAGYKSLSPYSIAPYEPEKPVDVKSLEERISNLERMMSDESHSSKHEQSKPHTDKKHD